MNWRGFEQVMGVYDRQKNTERGKLFRTAKQLKEKYAVGAKFINQEGRIKIYN